MIFNFSSMYISKITLGTAQLGMDYGIANLGCKPNFSKATRILNYAWNSGINSFDTSPLYGDSERIIGSFISSYLKGKEQKIIIISKLSKINGKNDLNFEALYRYIKEEVRRTLKNLMIKSIPIYLLHHAPDIYIKDGLILRCLNQIKREKLIESIGISVYNLEEIETVLHYNEINVIQAPMNLFDHRLIQSGLLKKLRKKDYIILVRSVYLQGLFFIAPENIPNYLKIAMNPLKRLRNLVKEYEIDIAKLAFLFIRDIPEITSIVVGAENVEQIEKNIQYLDEKPLPIDLRNRIVEDFSELDEKIIKPYLWNK